MTNQGKTTEELVRFIETNKHDITMRLRAIVLTPITLINRPNAAEQLYFSEKGIENDSIKKDATAVMQEFGEKWRNENSATEEQLAQMRSHIAKIPTHIIPAIHRIVGFYALCKEKKYYFSNTDNGNMALKKMSAAVRDMDKVCDDLLKLDVIDEQENDYKFFNLLELLQEGFDDILATIEYRDILKIADYQVNVDREKFLNHVLINLRENMNNHAFGTSLFQKKHIWERKVLVDVAVSNENYVIRVCNNGEPFLGDPAKVYEYGYCHGSKKQNGIGMYSAKKNIEEMGGTIEFQSYYSKEYTVEHIITIPRNGK